MQSYILSNKEVENFVVNLTSNTFRIPKEIYVDIIEVPKGYAGRPDLVSMDVYGNEDYWDIICKLNRISCPFDLKEDQILIIPTYDILQDFYIIPNKEWSLLDKKEDSKMNPKDILKKNNKTINKKRFTIDTTSRRIIY